MRAFVLVMALLMAGGAWAQQQPRNVGPAEKVEMSVGQTNLLRFNDAFGSIVFSQKDVAELIPPRGDREFAYIAKQPGITRLMVATADGKSLYDAEIFVSPDRGTLVKIYGTGKNDDLNAGFVAVYCDPFGCSRPDKDLPMPTSVTVNRHTSRGSGARPPGGSGF